MVRDDVVQVLEINRSFGPDFITDVEQFDWSYLYKLAETHSWGEFLMCQMACGVEGALLPCQYDDGWTVLAQVAGVRQVLLFGPTQVLNMYPYPVVSPHNRCGALDSTAAQACAHCRPIT